MKALSKILPPTGDMIAKAGELIAKAKRPIAVLGSSAMRIANPDLLRQVIERHNLPFATTTMAKGMIDEDHPLSIGVIERSCRQIQRKLLRSADLIVGLGYDTVEVEYEAWIADVPLLQVDIDKVDVAPSVKVAHEVTGDLDTSLAKLAALPASTNAWTPETLAEHRRAFQAALRPATNTFTAHAAIDAVRRALPREGLAVVRRRRAHPPDREPVDRARAEDLPHHQRLVVDGLRPARRDRGEARAAGPAGRLHARRRLLPDDLRRGRGRQAHGHHAAGRRARRQMARADQGEADPPPVSALRNRIAGGGIHRAAAALFRRARGRRPQRRRSWRPR